MRFWLQIITLISICYTGVAQQNDVIIKKNKQFTSADLSENPLAPAKAAFYSAVLPGLGQAYNKKYWKIPFVYAALGTTVYFYKRNNDNYKRYLTALKLKLDGKENEFGDTDIQGLERGINYYKKNRDLMLFATIGVYILNVLEANVDAHLPDKKLDSSLSFQPNLFVSSVNDAISYGITLNYQF